jgi:hypothetical protein
LPVQCYLHFATNLPKSILYGERPGMSSAVKQLNPPCGSERFL